MSVPPMRMDPVMRTPSMRSFIRLRQRSNVLLPHPDGPMYAVMRCLGTAIETSLSACLAPYQKLTPSISTMGVSITGSAPGRAGSALAGRDSAMTTLLHRRRRVRPAEPVPQADGEHIQAHDDQQQQEGRREHHGPGRVHVRRLESDVVDVKAEVHELAIQVEKR